MKSSTPDYLASIPTSAGAIKQGLLDIENKERSNLFAWNGQFSPQLVEVLLETYASKGATVLDLFAGSGTVLYECGRAGLRGIAAEINPAAFYIARTYTFTNLSPSERTSHIRSIEEALAPILLGELGLWRSPGGVEPRELKRRLMEALRGFHGGWERVLSDTLLVASNFERLQTVTHVSRAWDKLKQVVSGLPHSSAKLEAINCDARNLPVPAGSVDLVITSPPYINVFNYHQQYRESTEALGWDLLAVAKSEIGSNRKHRSNRFLTVVQYCLDITMALSEINRVCSPSAHVVFVVGRESTVRGVRFFNGEIVGRLASKCTSLRVDFRQERSFKNRFGATIVEDILHFSIPGRHKHCDLFNLADARELAAEVLRQALVGVIDLSAASDIRDALGTIDEVRPSPTFRADAAGKS